MFRYNELYKIMQKYTLYDKTNKTESRIRFSTVVSTKKDQTTMISIILFISVFVSPQDNRKFSQPDCNDPSPKPFI